MTFKGTENCVADALSRIEINAIHTDQCPSIDFAAIAAEKQTDPELTQLDKTSLKLQAMPIPATILPLFAMCPQEYHVHMYPISLDDTYLTRFIL